MHVLQGPTSPVLPSGTHPGAPSSSSRASSLSPQCTSCHSCRGMHCNSTLGVTPLHCLPVLSAPCLQCSLCFPNVGLSAVFAWHFIHKPSSLLFSTGMHLFTFMRVCRSVFTGLIDAKCIADFLKLLAQTTDVQGAELVTEEFGY